MDIQRLFDRGFAECAKDVQLEVPLRIYCFGCLLASEKKWSEALSIYRALEAGNWQLHFVYYAIGACLDRLNRLEEAIEYYDKSYSVSIRNACLINKYRNLKLIYGPTPPDHISTKLREIETHVRSAKREHLVEQDNDSSHGYANYYDNEDYIDSYLKEFESYFEKGDSILDVGCNVGSKLYGFYRKGCRNNGGIEINANAVQAMKKTYPDLYSDSTIYVGDADEEMKKIQPLSYDVVHLHYASAGIFHSETIAKFFQVARKAVFFCDGVERNPAILHGGLFFHDFEGIAESTDFQCADKLVRKKDNRWNRQGTRWIYIKK